MKEVIAAIALLLFSYHDAHAADLVKQQGTKIVRTIDCRNFVARAVTVVKKSRNGQDFVSRQVLTMKGRAHRQVILDLNAHASRVKRNTEKYELDGVAAEWRCLQSDKNGAFLEVTFFCQNHAATSCAPGRDDVGHEWAQIYTPTGRKFFRDPLDETWREEGMMSRVGIYLPNGTYCVNQPDFTSILK